MAPGRTTQRGAAPVAPRAQLEALITVRQPFASAIFLAGKDVENRTWATNYRGRLWIHAAVRSKIVVPRKLIRYTAELYAGLRADEDLPRGAIIGHVTLVDIVKGSQSAWAMRRQLHWLLEDPVLLDAPIAYRGRQSLTLVDPASFLPRRTRSQRP